MRTSVTCISVSRVQSAERWLQHLWSALANLRSYFCALWTYRMLQSSQANFAPENWNFSDFPRGVCDLWVSNRMSSLLAHTYINYSLLENGLYVFLWIILFKTKVDFILYMPDPAGNYNSGFMTPWSFPWQNLTLRCNCTDLFWNASQW